MKKIFIIVSALIVFSVSFFGNTSTISAITIQSLPKDVFKIMFSPTPTVSFKLPPKVFKALVSSTPTPSITSTSTPTITESSLTVTPSVGAVASPSVSISPTIPLQATATIAVSAVLGKLTNREMLLVVIVAFLMLVLFSPKLWPSIKKFINQKTS